jgi:hypothetical protein
VVVGWHDGYLRVYHNKLGARFEPDDRVTFRRTDPYL